MNGSRGFVIAAILVLLIWENRAISAAEPALPVQLPAALPGTELLDWQGDIASRLVDGADRFLLRELEQSINRRAVFWHRDTSSAEKYTASLEPNQQRLNQILGVRDPRVPFDAPELIGTTAAPALIARGANYEVFSVRWSAFGDVTGTGLLLVPKGKPLADVVAIPDADQTPEMLVGLTEGVPAESQFARRLCESGCRVLVPVLISRAPVDGKISGRELLYRSAFELGRHVIGYEVQKVLAAVDWFSKDTKADSAPIGVIGWGEGGLLALDSGALDPRIKAVCVSGYFDSRQNVWREPGYRNVFGLLEQFGDAELASMIVPRALVIEAARGPEVVVPPGTGAAPGRLVTPRLADVREEVARARALVKGASFVTKIELIENGEGRGAYGSPAALEKFLSNLVANARLANDAGAPSPLGKLPDAAARQRSQWHELDRHNQTLLAECARQRKQFFAKLDTSSTETFRKTVEPYRDYFATEVVGQFDQSPLPPHPRTRKRYEGANWIGYEVVLDVFPDVFAYGMLLVPKNMKPGERRPVVVCQHGLEGRPGDTIEGNSPYYHDFAARLADRGFVTFAPQNLYLFGDRFRTLQRKANPLKKTLFSIIVPQHRQIVDWLASLPFVDRERIAFYGLSYGGKTAMRVPPLVPGYSAVICSGDFNEWVWKNASSRDPEYSYVPREEYEIFEFDLGNTFNYAEMATLIAPRPFMVERGHFDGVAPDETVAYEFAKVRFLYEARLKLTDRARIEWFTGPHTIHGEGTFDFLHEKLHWPKR